MKTVNMNWDKFEEGCKLLTEQIKAQDVKITHVFGIPRGGLPLAVKMSHILDVPLIRNIRLIDKNTLVCDDISDTGETLEGFKDYMIATLYKQPTTATVPMFNAFTTKRWIVFPWEVKNDKGGKK